MQTFVFGDDAAAMHAHVHFNDGNIDLMFVGPGLDEAIKPWPQADGYWKKLGLTSAPGGSSWEIISETEAQYIVYRDRSAGSLETGPHILKARLRYRRSRKLQQRSRHIFNVFD
jgi:hypothetical protein